jgi:hypothetical protein
MMPWWKATFDDGTAFYLQAESEHGAALMARLMAWSVSGEWHRVSVRKEMP